VHVNTDINQPESWVRREYVAVVRDCRSWLLADADEDADYDDGDERADEQQLQPQASTFKIYQSSAIMTVTVALTRGRTSYFSNICSSCDHALRPWPSNFTYT